MEASPISQQSSSSSAGSSNCAVSPINQLSVELLARIFKHLTPLNRLKASEVCRVWAKAARIPWSDITHLEVRKLPARYFGAVLKYCSKLSSVLTRNQKIFLEDVNTNIRSSSLISLKFYNVTLCVGAKEDCQCRIRGQFKRLLARHFQDLPCLQELIWHRVCPIDPTGKLIMALDDGFKLPLHECGFLTRLQLTDCEQLHAAWLFDALRRLSKLECLALGCSLSGYMSEWTVIKQKAEQALVSMKSLRELCLINANVGTEEDAYLDLLVLRDLYRVLQQLEVFVFVTSYVDTEVASAMGKWIESHPSLRLLIFVVEDELADDNLVMPPRRRYPKGLGSDPLPFLNAFVGGDRDFADNVRFSQSDAAKFWPITERLPEFLDRPELAEIVEGGWAVDIIRNAEKNNFHLWDFERTILGSVSYIPNP